MQHVEFLDEYTLIIFPIKMINTLIFFDFLLNALVYQTVGVWKYDNTGLTFM